MSPQPQPSNPSQPPQARPHSSRGHFPIATLLVALWQLCRHNVVHIGLIICLGIGGAAGSSFLQFSQQQAFTRLEYELLKTGMTLTDAQAAIGPAVEVSRNEATVTYEWANANGSKISAVFKNNRLLDKQQKGLR